MPGVWGEGAGEAPGAWLCPSTALLTATSTPGAHTKSAKSTHASVAEVEQSNMPPLRTSGFKYQNYGLALAFP